MVQDFRTMAVIRISFYNFQCRFKAIANNSDPERMDEDLINNENFP